MQMWVTSWQQFLEAPIFGNSLENKWNGSYPHNLFMETLITTGALGLSCLIGFLYYIFKKIIWIIKTYPQYYFITVIFLVAFIRSMFTGSIYYHSWLAIGAGVIIAFDKRNLK